jgi:hypothetical protein
VTFPLVDKQGCVTVKTNAYSVPIKASIDVGELARYDRPMPTMADYDLLLSGPCAGTA